MDIGPLALIPILANQNLPRSIQLRHGGTQVVVAGSREAPSHGKKACNRHPAAGDHDVTFGSHQIVEPPKAFTHPTHRHFSHSTIT